MSSSVADRLIWVTATRALNPTQILEVFHGRGGHIEVYLYGRTCQLAEDELTDAGRDLLLPPAADAARAAA